jgi:ribosome biogenesis protein BRX1
MSDLRDLMPHAKKDAKFDSKERLVMLNESAEMKNCNNCIYFEARKHQDLYMWLAKCPNGPSIKFLVNNIHTMEEMKLTGNCLKGSRPIMSFDKSFDTEPHYKLFKEMILQIFGTPRNQPRSKPFIDHVFSWFIVDNRIWFRNYQIVYDDATKAKNAGAPVLVEVGPRFVLCPIKVFSGSFQGTTLYENPDYVSPNSTRAEAKKLKSGKYSDKVDSKEWQQIKRADAVLPPDVLADIFVDDNQDE